MKKFTFVLLIIFIIINTAFSEEISVTIKGMDDGISTNKQQDYKEAVMNAKLQAIEQAGAEITSISLMQNFIVKYDAVESKSEGVLLPGFQIMDIGYQTDGTYLIILTGKIKSNSEEGENPSEIFNKAMLYQKKEQYAQAIELLDILINNFEGSEYSLKAFDIRPEFEKQYNKIIQYELEQYNKNIQNELRQFKERFSFSKSVPANTKTSKDIIEFTLLDNDFITKHNIEVKYEIRKEKLSYDYSFIELDVSISIDGRNIGSQNKKSKHDESKIIFKF